MYVSVFLFIEMNITNKQHKINEWMANGVCFIFKASSRRIVCILPEQLFVLWIRDQHLSNNPFYLNANQSSRSETHSLVLPPPPSSWLSPSSLLPSMCQSMWNEQQKCWQYGYGYGYDKHKRNTKSDTCSNHIWIVVGVEQISNELCAGISWWAASEITRFDGVVML